MAPSIFLEREAMPGDPELRAALGRASALWAELQAALASRFAPLSEKWSYSGKAYGWSLQLRQRKRTVLYMIPGRGSFVASLALGEKAYLAARVSGLPSSLLEIIKSAPKYPEGRGVRIPVRTKKALAEVVALAEIKMTH